MSIGSDIPPAPDVVIIGSGMGGACVAYALASSGAKIVILECGDQLPAHPDNRDARAIFQRGVFRSNETWYDARSQAFNPGNYYYHGGNSKFYGAVLMRYRASDFDGVEHLEGTAPPWPFRYGELEPWYQRAEELFRVRGPAGGDATEPPHSGAYPYPPVPDEPAIAELRRRLEKVGLHPCSLPLGVDIDAWMATAPTPWDAFPDARSGKMDAETCALLPALEHPNVRLESGAEVLRLMAGASTLMGLLPTYSQIGIAAPLLLVLLRAVQGFAVGGEYSGAAFMAVETAPPGEKALRGSVVQSGAFLGLLLANGVFFLLASMLPEDSFKSWGWRIAFLLSSVILMLGYWIRRTAQDTPEFEQAKQEGRVVRFPLLSAMKWQPTSFLIVVGLYLGANVATYTVLTFAIAYGTVYAHVGKNVLLMATTIAAAVALLTVPLAARYADRNGYLKVFVIGATLAAAMAFPFFWSLNSGNPVLIVVATVVVLAGAAVCMVSVQQPIFTELFDTEFRYSGAGFAYGLGGVLGGLSPFVATYFVTLGGGTGTYPALFMAAISIVSLVTALIARRRINGIYLGLGSSVMR